jgi:hypothetical protein
MPQKLTDLLLFLQLVYGRPLSIETYLTGSDLTSFYESCYLKLYNVVLEIQKLAYNNREVHYAHLRKFYPQLDSILDTYLQ